MSKLLGGLFLLSVLFLPAAASAQQLRAEAEGPAYEAERALINTALETIVAVIQEATLERDGSGLTHRLRHITQQLTHATRDLTPASNAAPDDLRELRRLLRNLAEDLETLQEDLRDEEEHALANRLAPLADDLRQAVRAVERLQDDEDEDTRVDLADADRWLRPGRYRERRARDREHDHEAHDHEDEHEWEHEHDVRRHEKHKKHRRAGFDWRTYSGTVVGEFTPRWPFRRETGVYRSVPSVRYNRVEGLVLGIGREPMRWHDYRRARVYGQLGYAFSLDAWRYEAGLEVRLDGGRRDDFGLKLGGTYHRNTATKDAWKTSWLENSLAAFFFENDFFDYYETEGWSVYAVQRVTPFLQLSAGYREDDYRSLTRNTGWSVFDDGTFRQNPAIDAGHMQSLVFALEGGQVRHLYSLPRGAAFRLEAEIGKDLGGDFSFNRYLGDGRVYVPLGPSSLALRLRGGWAEGDGLPIQKTFSLGGLGSMRGYPQNAFVGSRMLLGNAEYIVGHLDVLDILDDFQLIGFFDAGWVNTLDGDAFAFDDVLPSAGLGLGLDDRAVRLELAFPLRDIGTDGTPTLWLRINPSF